MSTDKEEKDIDILLSRAVDTLIDPNDEFRNKLTKKTKGEYDEDIIIKLGADPTRPDIHLGHAVILRKLRSFQDLGCKIVFVVGDFTAHIGDPSGKSKVRPEVDQEEINRNMETYIDQVGKILRTEKKYFSWIRNSDWFTSITDISVPKNKKLSMEIKKDDQGMKVDLDPRSFIGKAAIYENTRMQVKDLGLKKNIQATSLRNFLATLKTITHSQLINRDMFQKRLKAGEDLYMHEMMYPVLQAIDSVALSHIYGSCDLEVGGTDQTFNMLLARDVMKRSGRDPQSVLTFELLEGTDGSEKMSKSADNYIGITDEPNDMYGKVMSIADKSIAHYFTLCTYSPESEIEKIAQQLESGKVNPRDLKMRLAREIVAIYHGEDEAEKAEAFFESTFSEGQVPENIETVTVSNNTNLLEVLQSSNLVESSSEFRRLVDQGAVTNMTTGEKVEDYEYTVSETTTFKIGKKRFIKVMVN